MSNPVPAGESDDYTPPNWATPSEGIIGFQDWRSWVSEEILAAWDTFSDLQKRMIARNANHHATSWDPSE